MRKRLEAETLTVEDILDLREGAITLDQNRRFLARITLIAGFVIAALGLASLTHLLSVDWKAGSGLNQRPAPEAPGVLTTLGLVLAGAGAFFLNYKNDLTLDFRERRFVRFRGFGQRTGGFDEIPAVTLSILPGNNQQIGYTQISIEWADPADKFTVFSLRGTTVAPTPDYPRIQAQALATGFGCPLIDRRSTSSRDSEPKGG